MATFRFGSSRHIGALSTSVDRDSGGEAVSRKGIPLRAFENNQSVESGCAVAGAECWQAR
jgi:hypothetical protein